jgi:hypothetical protein
MTRRIRIILAFILLCSALSFSRPVSARLVDAARPATSPTWSSRIAYANPTAGSAKINVTYIASNGTTTSSADPIIAPAHSSGVILAGSVNGGTGAAVVSADASIVAVYEQFAPNSTTGTGQPLYDAFDANQAGDTIYIPYFVFKFSETGKSSALTSSTIGVQNITSDPVSVTISSPTTPLKTVPVPAQASYIFTGADLGLKASYRGPLVLSSPNHPDSIVAAALLTGANIQRILAFEGQSQAESAQTIFFSRPGCGSSLAVKGYFYIQNASQDTATTLNLTFYSKTGAQIQPQKPGNFSNLALAAKDVRRIDPCADANLRGTVGAIKVDSTTTTIVGVGILTDSVGLSASYTGQILPVSAPPYTYVLPYVTWKVTGAGSGSQIPSDFPYLRTDISVLNIGSGAASVNLDYYRPDGTLQNSLPVSIDIHTSVASSPAQAGVVVNRKFEGSVIVTSDQPLIVTAVRTNTILTPKISTVREDYTARLFQ